MERREFLRSVLGSSVLAAVGPATASARARRSPLSEEEAAIGAQADTLRAALATREAHIERTLRRQIATDAPLDEEVGEVLAILARGMGAAATLGEVDGLSVRTQAHPWIQAFLLELGERVGAALLTVQELLTPVAEGLALPHAALLGALEALEALTAAVMPAGQRAMGRRSVRRLHAHLEPAALQTFAQQALRRIRALQHIAVRAAARGQSGSLLREAPALAAEVQTAQVRWAEAAADGNGVRVGLVVLGILGLVACGALLYYGTVVIALGVVGLVACVCVGVIILAAGVLILTAGVIVGVVSAALLLGVSIETISSRVRRNADAASTAGIPVEAGAGWVPSPLALQRSQHYWLEVQGQTLDPIHDLAPLGPGGDSARPGGPGWRQPGMPEGALLGQVRGAVFLIGAARTLPEGLDGVLSLAINVEEARATARGGVLTVRLTPMG